MLAKNLTSVFLPWYRCPGMKVHVCHQLFSSIFFLVWFPWTTLTRVAFLKIITSNPGLLFSRLGFIFSANGALIKDTHSFSNPTLPSIPSSLKHSLFDYYPHSCHHPTPVTSDPDCPYDQCCCSHWEHTSDFSVVLNETTFLSLAFRGH